MVLVVLAACPGGDGGGGTGPDTRVRQVVVTAPSPSVEAGAAVQLSASARNAAGAAVGGSFTWTSSNSAVAAVAANGEVQGAAPGTATITATETGSGVAGSMGVTVVPAAVQSVVVDPAAASIQLGRTQNLTATLRDARGGVLTGRAVAWTTSNPAIATVNGAGVVTATGVGGPVTITANAEGRNGTAQITVLPVPIATLTIIPTGPHTLTPGATLILNAVAYDAQGNALSGRALSWTSANPAVASVSGTGVVSAVALGGPVAITATSEGVSATVQVTVALPPVATVTVSPAQQTLAPGATFQFTAVARDALVNPLTGRAVTWTTANPAFATVSATGLVTAHSEGQVTVTATVEGRSGTALITVTPAPIATLAITPAGPHTLVPGATLTLNAVARDAAGNALTGRSLSWTSGNPAVVSVSGTGVVTGVATGGPVAVTATSEGVSATVQVTVAPAPVATVSVTPPQDTVELRESIQFAAVALDAGGRPLTGRAVTWTISDPLIATVSPSGAVTGQAVGRATVMATVEGHTGTALITVIPRQAAAVTVDPRFLPLDAGQSRSLRVSAVDAAGAAILSPIVRFVSYGAEASVNPLGLVTANFTGQTFVISSVDHTSDTTFVAVLGEGSLLSTAFANGQVRPDVRPGTVVEIPVILDMSRASPAGDLGSVQGHLRYDVDVLEFQSAQSDLAGSVEINAPAAGIVNFAFAGTAPQGRPVFTVLTVRLRVLAAAPVGRYSALSLFYSALPTSTTFQNFVLPTSVSGRVRVVAP
nr:Ig-like domain-containing protein [Longimicrobium terrae]